MTPGKKINFLYKTPIFLHFHGLVAEEGVERKNENSFDKIFAGALRSTAEGNTLVDGLGYPDAMVNKFGYKQVWNNVTQLFH